MSDSGKRQPQHAPQVKSVDEKDMSRNPAPPFMTSTLQQEAFNRLGFSPSATMQAAQQLYEGPESVGGDSGALP